MRVAIHRQPGRWVIEVLNQNGLSFAFRGATEAEQLAHVRMLASAMRLGRAATRIGVLQNLVVEQANAQLVTDQLFGRTSMLLYEGVEVYESVAESLIEDIETAGRALVDFLIGV